MIAETFRDLAEGAFVFRMNGQEVYVRDRLGPPFHPAADEWLAINQLWRKEREDCGCGSCMEELRGPKAGGNVWPVSLRPGS